MKKVAVIIANGTEEIEALTPVDLFRRAGLECDLISVSGEYPKGSHGIIVKADKLVRQVDFSEYSAIVIPGGMPGAVNISNDKKVIEGIKCAIDNGKIVASICASPAVVLAQNELIAGRKVTCYPAQDFIGMFKSCVYTGKDVEVDGNLITANGPKSAMSFSLAICEKLGVKPKF